MTNYYSKTKGEYININDMHHQHVWYAFKKMCDEQFALDKETPKATSNTIFKLEDKVSELLLENKHLKNRIQSVYAEQNHSAPRYQFCEIPNDDEHLAMVYDMKYFLNKSRYTMRIRGQHLNKGEDWKQYQYGQPINKSSHLRVYIDQKKERK